MEKQNKKPQKNNKSNQKIPKSQIKNHQSKKINKKSEQTKPKLKANPKLGPSKNSLNEKLDLIIQNQKKILDNEAKILGTEQEIKELEEQDLAQDKQVTKSEEQTLDELEKIEAKLNQSIRKPLKHVTKRDLFKGFIGAFVGVMGHFAFSKAADLAKDLTLWQTTNLYIVAAFIITIMLYYTGFRAIEKQIVLQFMPLRAVTLYSVSIFTILLVNLLFGKIHFPLDFTEIYKLVGASIILAVMGAGTADLLGKVEGH